MRTKAFTYGLIAIAALVIASSALAQGDPRRGNDPIVIPKGKAEIQYRKPENVPRQLRTAVARQCDYKSRLDEFPIRVVRPVSNGRLIALVPCGGIAVNSMAFAIGRWWTPSPISFVVKTNPNGFGITRAPGYLEWYTASKTLTATQFTDMAPSHEWRHTYRYVGHNFPFVLAKIEYCLKLFGAPDQPWISYWEAPTWGTPK
jgi:hypothetical protein